MFVDAIGIISRLGKNVADTITTIRSQEGISLSHWEKYPNALVAQASLTSEQLASSLKKVTSHEGLSRSELMALTSTEEAIDASSLKFSNISATRIGVYVGTSLSTTDDLEDFYESYVIGPDPKNELLQKAEFSRIIDTIAHYFKFSGPRTIVSNACSSSTAILKLVESDFLTDRIDAAVVIGVDPLTKLSALGFHLLQTLAKERPSPFSEGDAGLALGEAAACMILLKDKPKNCADPIFVEGVGVSVDGYHPTAPDPQGAGARRAIDMALGNKRQIDLVVAHGSGTPLNDATESQVLADALDPAYPSFVVSSKGGTGHCLGAAGAINNVLGIIALRHNLIPPSFNFEKARPGCHLNYPKRVHEQYPVNNVLSESFGFGGNNGAAYFSKTTSPTIKTQESNTSLAIQSIGCLTSAGIHASQLIEQIFSGKKFYSDGPRQTSYCGHHDTQARNCLENHPDYLEGAKSLRYDRRIDHFSRLGLLGLKSLLDQTGSFCHSSTPIFSGCGNPPTQVLIDFYTPYIQHGLNAVRPSLFPNTVANAVLGYAALEYGLRGPAFAIPQFNLSGATALHYAKQYLTVNKDCNHAIAGAIDEYTVPFEKGLLQFGYIGNQAAFKSQTIAQRPPFAEGSIFMMLAKPSEIHAHLPHLEHSILGAEPIQNGYSLAYSCLRQTMQQLLSNSRPDAIVLNAYGRDVAEKPLIRAIHRVVGEKTPLYSPLFQFGHALGMSGLLGVVSAYGMLERQEILANIHEDGTKELRKTKGQVQNVWVITIKYGGSWSLQTLAKKT